MQVVVASSHHATCLQERASKRPKIARESEIGETVRGVPFLAGVSKLGVDCGCVMAWHVGMTDGACEGGCRHVREDKASHQVIASHRVMWTLVHARAPWI